MTQYFFEGVIYPERAHLSIPKYSLSFLHPTSKLTAEVAVSVILNHAAVWVDTQAEWDIYDLRNIILTILQYELSVIGYLKGLAYSVEVRRVINLERNVDYVFGIDMPCIAERNKAINLDSAIPEMRKKLGGALGVYVHRCLTGLNDAMKEPNDTGFFCYRAIESLRHHCAAKFNLDPQDKSEHWKKFREMAKCDEATLRTIKESGDALRHGDVSSVTSADRAKLLKTTWDVVEAYLSAI